MENNINTYTYLIEEYNKINIDDIEPYINKNINSNLRLYIINKIKELFYDISRFIEGTNSDSNYEYYKLLWKLSILIKKYSNYNTINTNILNEDYPLTIPTIIKLYNFIEILISSISVMNRYDYSNYLDLENATKKDIENELMNVQEKRKEQNRLQKQAQIQYREPIIASYMNQLRRNEEKTREQLVETEASINTNLETSHHLVNRNNNSYRMGRNILISKNYNKNYPNQKPIAVLHDDVDSEYNQIFLYNTKNDTNLTQIKRRCVGIIQYGNSKYLVYEILDNQQNVSLKCKQNILNSTNVQCNKNSRTATDMTKWTYVLQRYPDLIGRNEWFSTSQTATMNALLGPHYIDIVDYGERRILFAGENHYSMEAHCFSRYGKNDEMFRDPYFIRRFIQHIASSTQETIDVYIESEQYLDPNKMFTSIFTPRITYHQLQNTLNISNNTFNPNKMYSKTLRVHGSDIRFVPNSLEINFKDIRNILNDKDISQIKLLLKRLEFIKLIGEFVASYKTKIKNSEMITIDDLDTFVLKLKRIEEGSQNIKDKNYLSKQLQELKQTNENEYRKLMHYIYLYYGYSLYFDRDIYEEEYLIDLNNIYDSLHEKCLQIITNYNSSNYINNNLLSDSIHIISHINSDKIESYKSIQINYYAFLMDIYTIARILRNFHTKQGKIENYRMNTSINSIYIAGDAHRIKVQAFFELFIDSVDIYTIQAEQISAKYKEQHNKFENKIKLIFNRDSSVNPNKGVYSILFRKYYKLIKKYRSFMERILGRNNNTNPLIQLDDILSHFTDIDVHDFIKKGIKYYKSQSKLLKEDFPTINKNYMYYFIAHIYKELTNTTSLKRSIYERLDEYKSNINLVEEIIERYYQFEQTFIEYFPLLQKYTIEMLTIIRNNYESINNKPNNISNIDKLNELIDDVQNNWNLPQCNFLSNIKQPIFVRFDKPHLIGIKIKESNDPVEESVNVGENEGAGVGLMVEQQQPVIQQAIETVGGRKINKLWKKLIKYRNNKKNK